MHRFQAKQVLGILLSDYVNLTILPTTCPVTLYSVTVLNLTMLNNLYLYFMVGKYPIHQCPQSTT